MKFIINKILENINSRIPKSLSSTNNQVRIRINGFEDARIYEQVSRSLHDKYDTSFKVVTQLSYEKYLEFTGNSGADKIALLSIQNHKWVDEKNSLTYYRNLSSEEAKLIVLMGTEAVSDQGGLADCYYIDPNTIKRDIKKKFHLVFGIDDTTWSKSDLTAIDGLYDILFSVVPNNICKLSDIADSVTGVDSLGDFTERFFKDLPLWGLCKQEEELPATSTKNGYAKLIKTNFDTISHKTFDKANEKKFFEYMKKIEEYPKKGNYKDSWGGWAKQSVKTLSECLKVLKAFIIGTNIESNRRILLNVDFAIILDILNLRLIDDDPVKKEKDHKVQLYGSPLNVFAEAFLTSVSHSADEKEAFSEIFDGIKMEFKSIELADVLDPSSENTEESQIEDAWKQICSVSGGVIDFIRSKKISFLENDISIFCDQEDVFSPSNAGKYVEEGLISAAPYSKKVSKVVFTIHHMIGSNVIRGSKLDFEWNFSNLDGWCISFSHLYKKYQDWVINHVESVVPVISANNFPILMHVRTEEEFLDYIHQSEFDFSRNLVESFTNKLEDDEKAKLWHDKFAILGKKFVAFCSRIFEIGFFADINQPKPEESATLSFIDTYVKFADDITTSMFTESLEWVMNGFVHAFAIEKSNKAVITEENIDGCIIPPFHPAILQKIVAKSKFLLAGYKEWFEALSKKPSHKSICDTIDNLNQLSQIQEGIDIFKGKKNDYFGSVRAFANYGICGTDKSDNRKWLKILMQKDSVFDDDFCDTELKTMNHSARMLYDVINSYLKARPAVKRNLSIAVINPSELPPVIAAINKHITIVKNEFVNDSQKIQVTLNILVNKETKGGKNYLSYWANEFFSQDDNVDIKIYYNVWDDTQDLIGKKLTSNVDIVFMMNVLKFERYTFSPSNLATSDNICDCPFPVVYRPIPLAKENVNRRLEITQRQFSAATKHSQVVFWKENYENAHYNHQTVVKKMNIDDERRNLISDLHQKASWVVCIDVGMDGALLRSYQSDGSQEYDKRYSIIGFSTGKGTQSNYNLTITARQSIIDAVQKRLEAVLRKSFHWSGDLTRKVAENCISEAAKLDGISLLSAVNPTGYKNLNEFLAYILTSYQQQDIWEKDNTDNGLRVIIHLDSYNHWFIEGKEDDEKYRPDFLAIKVYLNENNKIHLDATVIECKVATVLERESHLDKSVKQASYGIKHLKRLFNPESSSINRRYWYAQLYKALAFAQVTFAADSRKYRHFAEEMRNILDGNFEIEWYGKAMLYWKDSNEESITVTQSEDYPEVYIHEVPQIEIQRILLRDNQQEAAYTEYVEDESVVYHDSNDFTSDKFTDASDSDSDINDGQTKHEDEETHSVIGDNKNKSDSEKEKHEDDETKVDIKNVRVYIGKDKYGKKVYWDFGHPELANRHLLITGMSGQGKTYGIQTMLKELAEKGVSSVIIDYTEGFTPKQLEPEFKDALGDKISQHIVYNSGIPINPFRRHEIEVGGELFREKATDVASRIAEIFKHVYKFGDQQFSAIFNSCVNIIDKYGDKATMGNLVKELENSTQPGAKTVLSKMTPFFRTVDFRSEEQFEWGSITKSNGQVTVFQLTAIVREIQVVITELMLWDAWYYLKIHGNKETPFVIVLDEAQNLSLQDKSPAYVILREGRKFGWSAWFATQSLKPLSDDEITNLKQAAYQIYYKPIDDEINTIAKNISDSNPTEWKQPLKKLHKGQCIVVGNRLREDNVFGAGKPIVTNVTSFEERAREEK